jgi:hypothetical protein
MPNNWHEIMEMTSSMKIDMTIITSGRLNARMAGCD